MRPTKFISFRVRLKDGRTVSRSFILDDPKLKDFQKRIDSGEITVISSEIKTMVKATYAQRGE